MSNVMYDSGARADTMPVPVSYKAAISWDDEAHVWVATSDEIPGLVLEHGSFDVLIERVRFAAPELLELNCGYTGDFSIEFITRFERLAISG